MCNFEKIIITTTSFASLKDAYPDQLKNVENKDFIELFSEKSKQEYFNSDDNGVSVFYIQLNNIFIFPSITNIPDRGFNAMKLIAMLILESKSSSKTLFILHRSDIGFGHDYMEKLLIQDDIENNSYCGKNFSLNNNVIVFQHDDGSSPNIYRDIILNSMLSKKLDAEALYQVIMEKYQLLNKPWAILIQFRNDLIMGVKSNPEKYHSINLQSEFGLDLKNIQLEEQIYEIEKCIIRSSIRQIK